MENKIIIIGLSSMSFSDEPENNVLPERKQLTYEDLKLYYGTIEAIPESIVKTREEMEKLATALSALSFGRQKVVINKMHSVNPHERNYKNKRKW
ncbi:hypothetical protein LJF28_04930 [Chryseobacterium indologenes]|uniref:hypothetical protein n=1 Tax=Chryseobacterium indologenes TaxID=253 RepID=UPI001D0D3455|nr:hypothetical protein [Chryseobacterium indologenes]UDQ55014.1 hypothetical protein LJF28_04930 [Chryseobacterium indologenes]